MVEYTIRFWLSTHTLLTPGMPRDPPCLVLPFTHFLLGSLGEKAPVLYMGKSAGTCHTPVKAFSNLKVWTIERLSSKFESWSPSHCWVKGNEGSPQKRVWSLTISTPALEWLMPEMWFQHFSIGYRLCTFWGYKNFDWISTLTLGSKSYRRMHTLSKFTLNRWPVVQIVNHEYQSWIVWLWAMVPNPSPIAL